MTRHTLTTGQRVGIGLFLFGLSVQSGISAYIIWGFIS
jgi:hypothetical protein